PNPAQTAGVQLETKSLEGLFVPRVPGMEFKMLGAVPQWPAKDLSEAFAVWQKGATNLQANDIEPALNPRFTCGEPAGKGGVAASNLPPFSGLETSALDDGVAQDAKFIDLDFHHVAALEEDRRL